MQTSPPLFLWRKIALLFLLGTGLPARRGRSAGPDFSAMRNRGKNRQRRGLPPPCGIHPAGTGCACVPLRSALGPVGSHGWCKTSVGGAYFSGSWYFYCQGLTLVCSCSQLPVVWLTAAGTPLLQGRPGGGNRPAIGPAAQGGLVWWHKQEPQPDKTGRKAT